MPTTEGNSSQLTRIQRYYEVQAKIYDLTRWMFLFGRVSIIKKIPFDRKAELRILEVGCGTGKNTEAIAERFPKARITAMDVSGDMLAVARKKLAAHGDRVSFVEKAYGPGAADGQKFDVIVCSYILSMIMPGYEDLIKAAKEDLREGGYVAVVDFHDTWNALYKKFMDSQHIHLEGQLLPALNETFEPQLADVRYSRAFAMWRYMLFLGKK